MLTPEDYDILDRFKVADQQELNPSDTVQIIICTRNLLFKLV